jgi:hypothetical protein
VLSLKRLCFYQTVLLVIVIFSLLVLAPLGLVAEFDSFLLSTAASVSVILQSNLQMNMAARSNIAYPGEFLLAASLVPVANYFCFALKQVLFNGGRTRDYKVIGASLRLHLGSAVIFMFYIFYRNSRTASEEDPFFEAVAIEKFDGLISV